MRNHNFKFRMYTGSKLMGKNSGAPIFAALFAGIAGSFAVLLVVIGVMNGFQDNYITRRVEIASYHASLMPIDNKQGCTYDRTIIDELYRQFDALETTQTIKSLSTAEYIDQNIDMKMCSLLRANFMKFSHYISSQKRQLDNRCEM